MTIDWQTVIIAAISSLLTLFVAWYFAVRKRIIIKDYTYTVIKNTGKYEKLKVMYEDKEINELKLTKILFKNIGNKEIIKDNIRRLDIIFDKDSGISFRKCNIEKKSDKDLDIFIHDEPFPQLSVTFKSLDRGENFSLNILHNSKKNPEIEAKINSTKVITNKSSYYKLLIFLAVGFIGSTGFLIAQALFFGANAFDIVFKLISIILIFTILVFVSKKVYVIDK
jgi:hypothetical protein